MHMCCSFRFREVQGCIAEGSARNVLFLHEKFSRLAALSQLTKMKPKDETEASTTLLK